ncbi:protein kinase domain-containing protein [Psychrobacter sp. I-STPA6b]|uniref:protein kinase domain-containing protein n=1 Tax=Psychrobacter sp. I-STPA6b TaxID=2585718 RepID=UPI001D0CDBF7|nr:protein kinase [Psychrobacter sp. I-STPA6b]
MDIKTTLKNWLNHNNSCINKQLKELGYQQIKHKRLSFITDNNNDNDGQLINALPNISQLTGLTKAVHTNFGRVMIKWQIHSCFSYHSTVFDELCCELCHEIIVLSALSQAKISQNLSHILPIYNSHNKQIPIDNFIYDNVVDGRFNQGLFVMFAMPYYPLASVNHYLKQHLSTQQKHALLLAMAQALLSIHQAGWVHGDVKPSNFLIGHYDKQKYPFFEMVCCDFAQARPNTSQSKFKNSGQGGTPAYLAPECWQGQPISVQSDVYAFGVMMMEILTGKRPFIVVKSVDKLDTRTVVKNSDNRLPQWALQHCQQPIPRLPYSYHRYQPIVDKLLAKYPNQRYQSMAEVVEVLSKQ